ncbi:DUF2927 domain-containing protein [Roseovarius sp. SCSIO 43702]|uniref:DUF2927 domain-containing protein n=1 Tax=Roseovarius sp. SCSIO 43702 TaxID=2823043 RepID=UPI001C73A96F|nr:DUF2927 domain-containing protein [Roseovarius sp. SCSIO 43702]QYX56294.1 DUF2927 domain-containing protein [Roseovarius sp. SCSIO 43702]
MAVAACTPVPERPQVTPQARPAGLVPPKPAARPGPSERSLALARRYEKLEMHLVAQGLLRTDGGGPDTYYSDADLLRNFERIVFYDEHDVGGGVQRASNRPGVLRKWEGPVRLSVAFGSGVAPEQRAADRAMVARYARRLARVTGHPIAMSDDNPNFQVFFMTVDDGDEAQAMLRAISPNVNVATLSLVGNLPQSIYCLVTAFGGNENRASYARAVAFVRAEHPPLMRKACVHEEVAQGLGLANDSPRARPSIFNDDDEFALLTTHDEKLLELLYNPALRPGMTIDEARPILRRLVAGEDGTI